MVMGLIERGVVDVVRRRYNGGLTRERSIDRHHAACSTQPLLLRTITLLTGLELRHELPIQACFPSPDKSRSNLLGLVPCAISHREPWDPNRLHLRLLSRETNTPFCPQSCPFQSKAPLRSRPVRLSSTGFPPVGSDWGSGQPGSPLRRIPELRSRYCLSTLGSGSGEHNAYASGHILTLA